MSRLNPAVLAAIAAVEARQGNLHGARVALRRADPLRQPHLLGQVKRALREAEDRVGAGLFGDEAARHVARVAYLLTADVEISGDALIDLEEVRVRYEAELSRHPAAVPRGFPLTPALVGLLLVAGLSVSLWWILTRERTPSLDGARRTPPSATGAFARGGQPARKNATLGRIFAKALPQAFIAVSQLAEVRAEEGSERAVRAHARRLDSARSELLNPAHLRALGEHPAKRLADVLAAIENAAFADTTSVVDETAKAFFKAVDLLNRELAAGDFAYHLVGDLLVRRGRRLVLVATYGVEEVVPYKVEGQPVTVLRLDRLDETNWSPARLGSHRPDHLASFVEMSSVRRDLVTYVIPELITEGGLIHDGRRLSNEVLQKEHQAILGDKVVEDLVALGTQLGRRIRILRRIQRHRQTKVSFLVPDTLARDRELLGLFRKNFNAPVGLVDELKAVLDAIEVPAYEGLVERIARIHVLPTEAFVLQLWHDSRLRAQDAAPKRQDGSEAGDGSREEARGARSSLRPPMARHLASLLDSSRHNQAVAAVARDQTSGYLSSLANSGPLTRTVLTKLSGHIFDPKVWHTPRYYAALVIFKEFGRILEVPKAAALMAEGDPDRQVASDVYAALVEKEPEALRQAARQAFEHLFGTRIPTITGGPGD